MGGMYRETGMFRYKEPVRPHESVHALPEQPLLPAALGFARRISAGQQVFRRGNSAPLR